MVSIEKNLQAIVPEKQDSAPVITPPGNTIADCLNAAEAFLKEFYLIRFNIVTNKQEYCIRGSETETWLPVTENVINSMTRMAKKMGVAKNPKSDIKEYIYSSDIATFDPVADYLAHCPEWDHVDHITPFLTRIPGITPEQVYWASKWLLSMMAHWLDMDRLYGNQSVLLLIGDQGCHKGTFCRKVLPPELRDEYFLDHVNLANKFDKEMALTHNLLVNIDEFDKFKGNQQAELKYLISKPKVNGRPIYGKVQEDRRRWCSFMATTNSRHPLKDPSGSRRYIVVEVPSGEYINVDDDVNYQQIMAQLYYQLTVEKRCYWFTDDEVIRIQEANLPYMQDGNIIEMIDTCFRKPEPDEQIIALTTDEIIAELNVRYPSAEILPGRAGKIQIGAALAKMGIEHCKGRQNNTYLLVKKAA